MNKEEYVYQVFETIAPGYDAANARISLGRHLRWKKAAVRRLLASVPPGGHVLDLCCGTGDMAALMLASRPDIAVTGLDFSPAMLAEAAKRLDWCSRISLVQGNAMALPFEDERFDGAIISFALRNTADYKKVLGEMARVCKKGAPACCIDSFQPTLKLIRPFYNLYFSRIMPLLGGRGGRQPEYRWLCQSTKEYICPDALRNLMAECGLLEAETASFMLGSCVSVCTYKEGKKR